MPLDPGPPPLVGLHHVRLPVADVEAGRDWLVETFGFRRRLETEDEDGVIAAVLEYPAGTAVSLQRAPAAAAALAGFPLLVLTVAGRQGLVDWVEWLDHSGVAHGPVTEGHAGLQVDVTGPAGLALLLHTGEQPATDEP